MKKILLLFFTVFYFFASQAQLSDTENLIARDLVNKNKDVLGLSAESLNNYIVSSTYDNVSTGYRMVYLQQSFKGIPVYNQMLVLAFKNGNLISKAGAFNPSFEKYVNINTGVPAQTPESAVQAAIADRRLPAPSQPPVAIIRNVAGDFVVFSDMGISREKITAQLIWAPIENTTRFNLAWQVYLIPKTTPDYWMVRVDAVNNKIIGVDNYTASDHWGTPDAEMDKSISVVPHLNTKRSKSFFDYKNAALEMTQQLNSPDLLTTATYRVIPIPAESPIHPGGAPALRTDPWLAAIPNAVTLKWHTGAGATDYNYTRGNNVFAYQDRANDNSGTVADAATSSTALPSLTFDFVPNFTVDPTQTTPVPNQQFNTTNLFYWNNVIHDVFYGYGFNEISGNFQDDNLGRGGAGNDHVNAEAQDGGGTNNAFFSTPADGSSGRMQMYLWTGATPFLDGDVDNGIIVHEYGHGISNRLTGGPANVSCLNNAEQAGEGWSDYFSLMLTQNWATSTLTSGFDSPRGIGTYALNQPITGPGIRPSRYCTNFAVNNVTYANLPGQAIPHGVGFVWCTALWEMTWEIINEVGSINPNIYDVAGGGGNTIALRLVVEGLRLQQCNPGFISARNAIIQADANLYGGLYNCAIVRAFARRGMGLLAAEGSTGSITDQTVDFSGGGPSMAFTQNGVLGIPEGQNIIYSHSITAQCAAMTNFVLRDTLPLNVTFVSATNGGTYNGGTRVVSWPVNLAANATGVYGLTVNINAGSYFPPIVLINEPVPSTTIPAFWTPSSTTANVWIAHNVRSKSAPNSFFTPNAAVASDQILATTNSFALGATTPTLSFWHWYNSESTWDGGVLEISTNGGGAWTDIGAANFTQNGYNATLNAGTSTNPIAGRAAWSGNSTAFIESKVNLTPYANQPNVKLRWRFGSDGSLAVTGWNLDDITLQTIAEVKLRSSLFNASDVRILIRDTVTVILPLSVVPPAVTINQAASQPDPTAASPINFTVVFDQVVSNFATGDVTLSGTAGATTATVTGSGTTYNVAVSGMTGSGTVIATIAAGVCTNGAGDPNLASTSTDNTVTFNLLPPGGCVTTIAYAGSAVAIPDNTAAGINLPVTVSGVGLIADLDFKFLSGAGTCDATPGNTVAAVDHTFIGDLIFRLTSPGGTTVTLVNRRGGTRENICNTTLDDDGGFPALSTVTSTTGQFLSGNFAPDNPLSAFDGENADGVWTLNVSDNAGVDIGSVRRFALAFTSVPPALNPVANQIVCNNSPTAAVTFTSPTAGTNYNWVNNTPSIGLAANGTGNIASFVATNATAAPVTATITVTPFINVPGITPTTTTFNFTGGAQTFTVPAGVTSINITTLGAEGGSGATGGNGATGGPGGRGSRATGTLAVTPGQVLNIFVGGAGGAPTAGFNGGGTGGSVNSGGGGGASDVRFPGASAADRILVAGGGGGGGRAGCELNTVNGGAGGNGDGNGVNGTNSPSGGGGFGAIGVVPGLPGVGCVTFLGSPGIAGVGPVGGDGGGGQNCCCFGFASVPGGGGGGGGFLGGAGGGGGSAGTVVCAGNEKGGGGGGAGGTSYTGGVTAGAVTTNIQTGNGQVVLNYNVPSLTTCSGTPTTFTITVNPTPVAVSTPASQTICSGATITTIALTSATSGTTFTWIRNNTGTVTGIAANGSGNISGALTNTTNAPVTVSFTITPTANGCPGAPITATVLVNPTPNAVATPATQTVCTGTAITTIVLTGAVSGTTYNWTRNNTVNVTGIAANGSGNISGTLVNTTTVQQTVLFTITPTANGCPGAAITATVIVNPTPTVTCPANITVNNNPGICGAVVTYATPTTTGTPAPTLTYAFTGATTGSGSGSGSGSTFNVGVTTVTVTATNVCAAVTCSFTVTVIDNQAPTITCPAAIVRNTDPASCTASIVTPNPVTADNCAVTVLTWVLTGATTGTSPATGINNLGTRTFNIGVTTVAYTVKDAAGNTSNCSYTVTVNDGQLPTITAQPVNRTVCAGSSVTFNVTAVTAPTAGGPIAYQWQQWNGSAWVNVTTGTGATTSALTFTNVSNMPQNTNTFRVVLTGLCTIVNSNAASLYINPLPTISLATSISPNLLPGQTLSITATVSPAGGSFVWFKNGVVVPGVTGAVLSGLTVDNIGTYRAVYTDPNGCVSTSADVTISGQPSNNLWVYPNPNTGVFQVRFYNTVNEAASIIIYDAKGARVHAEKFTTQTPYSRLDINISRMPAGTYIVEVVNGSGRRIAAKRIVKQM